jgi:Zn-finger nucleic acid-binding protein
LRVSERQGVEIDYCPSCRGVWLDRGELDKIVDRLAQEAPPAYAAPPPYRGERRPDWDDERRRSERRDYDRDEYYYKRRKKSFLHDLFDFD